MRAMCRKRCVGFSLVEILCVIGIMIALMGMLFPVFASAKRSAKAVQCLSNVRSIGLADLIYCGDNDDRFPYSSDDWSKTFSALHGADADLVKNLPLYSDTLAPYVKSKSIFESPLDSGMAVTDFGGMVYRRTPSLFKSVGSSYLYFVPAGLKLSGSSEFLSKLPLFMSAGGHWQCSCSAMVYGETSPLSDPDKAGYKYSISFGDGHAKRLSYAQWDTLTRSKWE
ncbi:MAG: type II secretion system protein [Armatimonadota bacterium]